MTSHDGDCIVFCAQQNVAVTQLRFQTLSGVLTVEKTPTGLLRMEFPLGQPVDVNQLYTPALRQEIVDALSLAGGVDAIVSVWFCANTRKLVVEVGRCVLRVRRCGQLTAFSCSRSMIWPSLARSSRRRAPCWR